MAFRRNLTRCAFVGLRVGEPGGVVYAMGSPVLDVCWVGVSELAWGKLGTFGVKALVG